jgi:hypothetical protein
MPTPELDDSTPESSPADHRIQALNIAHEHVQQLYAVKNDRGYPRFTGNVRDVLNEELVIARYLMGEE